MDALKNTFDLQNQFNNEEFVLKTQQQIAKDFAKFNMFFPESFENTPFSKEEIELWIADHLTEIMKYGETRLLQVLYTIDISEKQFLSLSQDKQFIQLLSEKILEREALKVYLRSKF
jgi:hypothetical protein